MNKLERTKKNGFIFLDFFFLRKTLYKNIIITLSTPRVIAPVKLIIVMNCLAPIRYKANGTKAAIAQEVFGFNFMSYQNTFLSVIPIVR